MALDGYYSTHFVIKTPARKLIDNCIKIMDLPKEMLRPDSEAITLKKYKVSFRLEGFQISEWYEKLKAEGTNIHDLARWPNLDGYFKLEGSITTTRVQNLGYEKPEGTMTTTHVEGDDCDRDERDRVILIITYEKNSPDIEDPKSIMDTFTKYVRGMDTYLHDEASK